MKKIYTLIFGAALLCVALPSLAQKDGKLVSVGFGIETGLPVAKAADVFNFNLGFTGRVSVHAGPGYATISSGGIIMIPKKLEQSNSIKAGVQIPIKGGYKYIFLERFFVMGELGYSIFKSYYDTGDDSHIVSTSSGGFTYSPSIGFNLGVSELALKYESIALDGGHINYLGFRAAFNF